NKFFSNPATRQCSSAKTCCAVGNPGAQRARYCRVGTAHLRADGGRCPPHASSLTSRIVLKIGHAPKCPAMPRFLKIVERQAARGAAQPGATFCSRVELYDQSHCPPASTQQIRKQGFKRNARGDSWTD